MFTTTSHFPLPRCPHCHTANPTLSRFHTYVAEPKKTRLFSYPGEGFAIQWHIYSCASCTGIVAAAISVPQRAGANPMEATARRIVPSVDAISEDIPQLAASYLDQSRETISSPSASLTDEGVAGATNADAQRCLEFAETIAELLFVLPARVKRGRAVKPTVPKT
jgi:glutaredoxin